MKLALATTFDSNDVSQWSGTPFYMGNAFENSGFEVERIGNLKRKLPKFFKLKQFWSKLNGQRESPRFNVTAAKFYSEQVAKKISGLNIQAVISPLINPIAYLDIPQPVILWTDALYASLIGFYSVLSNHSASSIKQGNLVTQECLSRVKFAIFSSDWAAHDAIKLYGVSEEKVKVIPFGANLICTHQLEDIRTLIKNRSRDILKLLFVGKDWHRKGADIVFNVVKKLHHMGQKVELHFVGCEPPKNVVPPNFIHCHGFISKRTPQGIAKMTELFRDSHFMFQPSRAEAYGIAFCEANAFGLPCLTSYVGGISTVVKDHINGMTFALDTPLENYCHYLIDIMQNYSRYEELALSSFHEYETRLNWQAAVAQVKRLIL